MGKTKKGQLFMLVKWINQFLWDVIDVDLCFKDNETVKKDLKESPSNFIGKTMDVFWDENIEEQSPAMIIAIGKYKDMEVKRTSVCSNHFTDNGEEIPLETRKVSTTSKTQAIPHCNSTILVCSLMEPAAVLNLKKDYYSNQQVQLMECIEASKSKRPETECEGSCRKGVSYKQKYKDLKKELLLKDEKIRKLEDGKSLLGELRDLLQDFKSSNVTHHGRRTISSDTLDDSTASTSEASEDHQNKVDIGKGVFVDKSDLSMMLTTSTNGTVLARSLMMNIFTIDEIKGSSLTGRACNASLHLEPKRALDKTKTEAIIGYALRRYPKISRRVITESLSNKIKEVSNVGIKRKPKI